MMNFSATELVNRVRVPETIKFGIFIGGVLTGVSVAIYVARPTHKQVVHIYQAPPTLPPPPQSLPPPPPPQTKQQQPPEPKKVSKWFPW